MSAPFFQGAHNFTVGETVQHGHYALASGQEPVLPPEDITDRIKAKLADLGEERDKALERAEKAEGQLRDAKLELARFEQDNNNLTNRVAMLEEKLDTTAEQVADLKSKVQTAQLRAEAERGIHGVEREKDEPEKRYETLKEKYDKVQKELQELESQLGGL